MTQTDRIYSFENAYDFIGEELGLSDWVLIDQDQVNRFGAVTRWEPWMHVDAERSAKESPYGGTLVHGFFMLSLITHFLEITGARPAGAAYTLNYGMDKVRIISPVVVGEGIRLRDRITLLDVTQRADDQLLVKTGHTIEAEGNEKPAVYAEYLNYVFAAEN